MSNMDDDTNTTNVPQDNAALLGQTGVEHRTLENVMEDNFFRYSMSVIIERFQ